MIESDEHVVKNRILITAEDEIASDSYWLKLHDFMNAPLVKFAYEKVKFVFINNNNKKETT
jgi:hypothetical protein